MNLRQLEILYTVIRCRTTVAAARQLGLSQPAVSNAIRSLETRAGFPLFDRVNNRLFPTREARLLFEDAKPIFRHQEVLETRMADLRENKGGQIRLLATPPLGYGPLPEAIRRFATWRPKARVFFDVNRLEQVMESVETHAVDLGIGMNMPERENVERETIHQGRMVCVFLPGDPLAGKNVVTPDDLTGRTLIALEAGTHFGDALRDSFRRAGVPFEFAVQVRYCLTACVMAQSGAGVAVVDSISPTCIRGFGLELRPFEPEVPVVAYAAWSSVRPLSRLARAFLRELGKTGQTLGQPRPT